MESKWNLIQLSPKQERESEQLCKDLKLTETVSKLLVQRGITSTEEVRRFFKPDFKKLHDPFLLPDMGKAVDRLTRAIGDKEKIMIYGDYDVDGTTAVALVYRYLRNFTSLLEYYIPDRYDEGYGISFQGIDYAYEKEVTLVIALDCGIKAIDKIEYAKGKGIDFIICDHHMPDAQLPDAVAVLDAKRIDSKYPYDHLCGCGVGFKFMQAFAISNGIKTDELKPLLDLVAVSIAADIVPITGENRILAHHGLKRLNSNPCFGLKAIIDKCGLGDKSELTMSDIVFKIGPRINASGRMMNGTKAVELLLANDYPTAYKLSENIDRYNEERKEHDKKTTDEAIEAIESYSDFDNEKAIIVFNSEWHKGVIGIVASRLTEKYYRPTLVLTESMDLITGSARSIGGFDIYKAIESCKDLLENFGGHTYAAGLSMKKENLEAFKKRFLAFANEQLEEEQLTPIINIDAEITFDQINRSLIKELKLMSPFGPGNEKPIFYSNAVKDYGTSKLVGKNHEHLKLELLDSMSTQPMHGIAFGMKNHHHLIKSNSPFNICYIIEENSYRGKNSIQLVIKDIKKNQI